MNTITQKNITKENSKFNGVIFQHDHDDVSNDYYAITWSPGPKFQFPSNEFTFVEHCRFLKEILAGRKKNRNILTMYPELHVNGTMHWHGVVSVNNRSDWYKKQLPSLKYKGYILIKPKINHQWFGYYIHKDQFFMRDLLNESNTCCCNCSKCVHKPLKEAVVVDVKYSLLPSTIQYNIDQIDSESDDWEPIIQSSKKEGGEGDSSP